VAGERANNREAHIHQELGGKSGGCASKAVELTSGDLRHVTESWLEGKRFLSTVSQKSAEGKVGHAVGKASEALQSRKAETDRPSRKRWSKARTIPVRGINDVEAARALPTGRRD
jgi:hypothetical protein